MQLKTPKRQIAWQLPAAVHQWLSRRFPGQSDKPLKAAVRKHLDALDTPASVLAEQWNTTLTGAYRRLAIMEYPELEAHWPTPIYTQAQLAGRRSYMRPDDQLDTYDPARDPRAGTPPLTLLRELRADLKMLPTKTIDARLTYIIKRLAHEAEQHSSCGTAT